MWLLGKTFRVDPFVYSTAKRDLHQVIEALIDVGNHIISERGYPKPETYAEVFHILRDRNVISAELFSAVDGMTSFRNLLYMIILKLTANRFISC